MIQQLSIQQMPMQEDPREVRRVRKISDKERTANRFDVYAGFREYNGIRAFLLSTNPETARRLESLTHEPSRGKNYEFKYVGENLSQGEVVTIANENYPECLRFREGFLFLTGNSGLIDSAKRNQIPVVRYSPIDDAVHYPTLSSILEKLTQKKDPRKMKIKQEELTDVVQEQRQKLSFEMQMHEIETAPFLVDETITLRGGCLLHLVPPADFSRKPRYDVVLETSDGTLFHLTNGRAYLPEDLARRFHSTIRCEEDFDLVREQYWETIGKFSH